MPKRKRMLALLCALLLPLLSGCRLLREVLPAGNRPTAPVVTSTPTATPAPTPEVTPPEEPEPSFQPTSMSLDENGTLWIERHEADAVPMGPEGTWTVFVYLCGTDLESDGGMATNDLLEMVEASTGGSVRFIVQAGGTYSWDNALIRANRIERYEICDGGIELVDRQPRASMGDGKTFADFLKWGVRNYPAAKMGVILWDHGGGSITGVCFDEVYGNDSLSLSEINGALAEVSEKMTDKFEFFGFDACLMGTVECANILASYARYMYGSEETEPGFGWDYTAIGNKLGRSPAAGGLELGRVVCDSFCDMCEEIGEGPTATFSIIDLSRIDGVITSFNTYAKNLYDASEDEAVLAEVVRRVNAADNFGGNNRSEGYSNMVDLAGIVNAGSQWAKGAGEVLSAIDEAVVYVRNGSNHAAACGLATYFPLSIQGSSELKLFGDISISPYYLSFVDRSAYGSSNNGSTEDYDDQWVLDFWEQIWNADSEWNWLDPEESWESSGSDAYWDSYSYEVTGESPLIQFYDEPVLLEDGTFAFSLTDESLMYTASVQGIVFMISDDGEDLIELGLTADIVADWVEGIFMDNFDGYWFSLPDGQNLAVYLVEECRGYDVYTSPVLLNGRETNLRITHNYGYDGSVSIDIAWDGIDEYGMAGRTDSLQPGDVIVPLYNSQPIYGGPEYQYYGEEYVYDGNPYIVFDFLLSGEYFYGFCIDDIYGDYYITDFVNFTVDGYDIYFSEDLYG